MPAAETPSTWVIVYKGSSPAVSETIDAAYYSFDIPSGLIEFKDANHKALLAVQREDVLSIRRHDTIRTNA